MRRSSRVAALLLAGLIPLVLGAASAGTSNASPLSRRAPEAWDNVKVIQHNVAKQPAAIQSALARAANVGAPAITLQEVCKRDFESLIRPAATAGGWTIAFHERRSGVSECDDTALGEVAIWKLSNGNGSSIDFTSEPVTDGKGVVHRFGMACVRVVQAGGPTHRLCSTHLIAFDTAPPVRASQTARIKQITSEWINWGNNVIVGGDFNIQPSLDVMDTMYTQAGTGNFYEADPCKCRVNGDNKNTANTSVPGSLPRKIDYVFYSMNRTQPGRARNIITSVTASDHLMVTASMMVEVSP